MNIQFAYRMMSLKILKELDDCVGAFQIEVM